MANQNSPSSSNGGNSRQNYSLMDEAFHVKKKAILEELEQLKNGTHPEYIKKCKELEEQQKNELIRNIFWHNKAQQKIEAEHIKSSAEIHSKFKMEAMELQHSKIEELNDRRKAITIDSLNDELNHDEIEFKPYFTRQLRRRPNDLPSMSISINPDKRRRVTPFSKIQFGISDSEIASDLKAIQDAAAKYHEQEFKTRGSSSSEIAIKSELLPSKTFLPDIEEENSEDSFGVLNTKIVDGKLLFEKRWYHRGQPVFIEGTRISQFSAVISSIGHQSISVKKTSDNSEFSFKMSCLSKRAIIIKRRAVV